MLEVKTYKNIGSYLNEPANNKHLGKLVTQITKQQRTLYVVGVINDRL